MVHGLIGEARDELFKKLMIMGKRGKEIIKVPLID
jgi:hypothetical protein